jgi:hypothetical protein
LNTFLGGQSKDGGQQAIATPSFAMFGAGNPAASREVSIRA